MIKELIKYFSVFIIMLVFTTCEKKNPCKDITCLNGVTYEITETECACKCSEGWEGDFCEKITAEKLASTVLVKFIGTWNAKIARTCYGSPVVCNGADTTYMGTVVIAMENLRAKINDRVIDYDTIIGNTIYYENSSFHSGISLMLNDSTGDFFYRDYSGGLAAEIHRSIKGKR